MTLTSNIRVRVDCTNPGQFFACCGLLELADRLWPGAVGWFEDMNFHLITDGSLRELLLSVSNAEFKQTDLSDKTASPITMGTPFRSLRVDWWSMKQSDGARLKTWAGRMDVVRIANAMRKVLSHSKFDSSELLNIGLVVFDPINSDDKVEPFYFDARRAIGSHSRDVGFSPDKLELQTTAFPAVEFLTLVGLQRVQPVSTDQARFFDYHTWGLPLPPDLLPLAITGHYPFPLSQAFRFENWYRTGQRKHKAFRPAQPITQGTVS